MSVNADGSPVTEPIANGGVTPEMRNEFQKVVMGILKDAMPRMIKQSLTESLPSLVEQIGSATKDKSTDKAADLAANDPARLNMKALENQINELKQQLSKRDEAIEQERNQRMDAQMRSQVREGLAGVLGADNPNLGLAMDSLYDARKRFVAGQDGSPLVRFKAEYGTEDDHLPLKEGLKKLAESELKHLMPSKTQGLPAVPGQRRGNAAPQAGASGPSHVDRFFGDIASQALNSSADLTQK